MKFVKIFLIVIAILIAALILIPIVFKGKIQTMVEGEINKNVNAKVTFADFGLSLIKSFPSLNVSLDKLAVVGISEFEGDTLVGFNNFSVDVNLMSAIMGEKIVVNSIILDKPKIYGKVLADGKANWDIAKPSETVEEETVTDTSSTAFSLKVKNFEIIDGLVLFEDASSKMVAGIKKLNYKLSGDMTQDRTILKNKLVIDAVSLIYEDVKYLNNVKLGVEAELDADLKNMAFTIKDNLININAMQLGANGTVKMPSEDIDIDIKFFAKETAFKEVLSLVPAIFLKDFNDIKTDGSFALNGTVKGVYTEKSLPAFAAHLKVNNAMFRYPDLPKPVEKINIDVKVNNPGGSGDNNDVKVDKFAMSLGGNPIDAKFHIKTSKDDIDMNGNINAKIVLETLKDAIPLEDTELKGKVDAKLKLAGKMSDIEKEQYEKFNATGSVLLEKLFFKSPDLPQGITMDSEMEFSPEYIALRSFDAKTPKSDFSLNGKLSNYLAFALKDELLKGELNFSSKMFDVNEFMVPSETPAPETPTDTVPLEAVKIPENIDFKLQSTLNRVKYDNFDIADLYGLILVKDSKVDLSKLKMKMLGGEVAVNGYYDSKDITNPEVKMGLDLSSIDIGKAAETITSFKKIAPIIDACVGKFSMKIDFTSLLDKNMNPVLSTLNGLGDIFTNNVTVKGSKSMTTIGDKLKAKEFKEIVLKNLKIFFDIKDGNIVVKPFDTKIRNSKVKIGGTQNLDQTMNFDFTLEVPRNELGEKGAEVLSSLASKSGLDFAKADKYLVDITMGGKTTEPKIKSFNLRTAGGKTVQDEVKDKAKKEVEKHKKELQDKADTLKKQAQDKAKAEAEKLKKEAEKKKAELKKKAAEEAKKKLKDLF